MVLELNRREELVKVNLAGAEITCKPYRAQEYTIAKVKTLNALNKLKKQREDELSVGVESKVPNLEDTDIFTGMYTHIFNVEVAKQVILEWQDITLNGEPAELNNENIVRLLEDGVLQEQFILQYEKLQREVEVEKK
ncbi:MAG: hypothetical protein GY793_09240 [Proteobacteria bacterium]|nr:hypothetical protein [Pseudomonadota bacterium]